ncbi:hypothetical protein RRX38_07780 [Pseudomonas sp. DTU_2021_1001937_2_SI_NGA_ILE_001]|uniref:hypothetical protein n=1 Tax=Pseudomonas sp. DTU_2021_1001937_2_SI_NGA_ILE_001 TaxID=3077589 RepID=UPI0025F346CA|nr:hypothetical protein [Pseudomonas sp. DTU_2021_1001937_2_SI_NGA_ILE_001]WNW11055.1 hypothetical protein RRX38_07780 [Pseudomonas sp. DTU_2021_1001937_2_SI_NGA_ILE_001]
MNRYLREFAAALVAYVAVLILSLAALARADLSAAARAAISLAPMLPGLLLCWAVVRQLRRLDELQLRIQFEALGFAFAASALLTFSYGFLEIAGLPKLSLFVVWPLMAVMWMLGLLIAARRYR